MSKGRRCLIRRSNQRSSGERGRGSKNEPEDPEKRRQSPEKFLLRHPRRVLGEEGYVDTEGMPVCIESKVDQETSRRMFDRVSGPSLANATVRDTSDYRTKHCSPIRRTSLASIHSIQTSSSGTSNKTIPRTISSTTARSSFFRGSFCGVAIS